MSNRRRFITRFIETTNRIACPAWAHKGLLELSKQKWLASPLFKRIRWIIWLVSASHWNGWAGGICAILLVIFSYFSSHCFVGIRKPFQYTIHNLYMNFTTFTNFTSLQFATNSNIVYSISELNADILPTFVEFILFLFLLQCYYFLDLNQLFI